MLSFNTAQKCFLTLSILLSLLRSCVCEELLELSCQSVTYCKQFQHEDVLVNCLEGRCQCSDAKGKSIKCKPKEFKQNNIIGGACPCILPWAECNVAEDVCYCAPHYVASVDRRRCLPKTVALGAECEMDAQCMGADIYAVCGATVHRCECGPNFVIHEGICKAPVSRNVVKAGMTATCRNNTDCQESEQLAFCSENKCYCPDGYVSSAPNRTSCIAITNFQKSCFETAQCLRNLGPGAKCHHDVCHCADGYIAQELHSSDGNLSTICERIVVLGQYCRTEMDCHQQYLSHLEQTMHCFYGECNCKPGYHSSDNISCSAGSAVLALNFFNLVALALSVLCWCLIRFA